jgi:hypothetical protein
MEYPMSHQTSSLAEIGNAVFQVLTIAVIGLLGLAEATKIVFTAMA